MQIRNLLDRLSRNLHHLALAASLVIFLALILGGITRASDAGLACAGWPLCGGELTPPLDSLGRLAYIHRLLAALGGGLLWMAAGISLLRLRRERLINLPLVSAAILMGVQIVLGRSLALSSSPAAAAFHLGFSLVILGLSTAATTAAYYRAHEEQIPTRLRLGSPFSRLALITLVAVMLMLVSGAVVSASEAAAACPGWPMCGGSLLPADPAGWMNIVHRLLVALAGLLLAGLLIQAWRTQRSQPAVIVAATTAAVLFFSQALLGAQQVAQSFPPAMQALHTATAVAVWAALAVLILVLGIAGRTARDERSEADAIIGRRGLIKDFLLLTKPVVVLLLLVTTYAGMVIGARAWPSLELTFWTLLGGFLAAGGSGAMNQYIDRFDDEKMQRTQKRPLPSGRLTPGEGLAFGVGIALASFYLLVAFVNLLAALLSLAGIIYYVLLYSILLKKTTVQNIVIGGGAGAIPPLVGWAAATGSLNVPSLLLFAIVFMWTPPHFWALALVRRQDYARAGVPMLPVVRGEQETRWQILLYTIELVGLTLLLPLFGLGGSIY
ncbi:MAG TPA: heme o synthase, partial [Anaerolineales bacterium]|nr:heme o synthase [Anaerolineales bacterium]